MTRERPPLLLRLSVVVGALSLFLGLVGVGLLLVRGDVEGATAGPGLGASVRVLGAPDDARLAVVLAWSENGVEFREEGRRTEESAHRFVLPPLPEGRMVTMEVLDVSADPPRSLVVHRGECRPGEEIVLDLADAHDR